MKTIIVVLMMAMRIRSAAHDIEEINALRGYIDCYNVMIDMKNGNVVDAINDAQYVDSEYMKEVIFNSKGN